MKYTWIKQDESLNNIFSKMYFYVKFNYMLYVKSSFK